MSRKGSLLLTLGLSLRKPLKKSYHGWPAADYKSRHFWKVLVPRLEFREGQFVGETHRRIIITLTFSEQVLNARNYGMHELTLSLSGLMRELPSHFTGGSLRSRDVNKLPEGSTATE